MERVTLEQSLIAARPDESGNSRFVDRVMQKVQGDSVIISSVGRTKNEQQNYKGGLFMNTLRTLPIGVLVVLIIVTLAVTGGVAYAVYKTVIEPLSVDYTQSVSEDGKRKTTFALQGCPSYDGVSQEEITAVTNVNSDISDIEARNYVVARCEQNAITKYAHDMVAAKDVEWYDSSILSTWRPVAMPAGQASTIDLDVGPRKFTDATEYYKDGRLVERGVIPEGSLVHVAYGGVESKAEPVVHAVMLATMEAKYYDSYGSGAYQRVPCHNNPSESCFSGIPGYVFYKAVSVDTGPVPPKEQRYAEAAMNKSYVEFGGVITYIDGNAFTFRTTMGRTVTFYLPGGELERDRAPEQALPTVGTEIIVTSIGDDRDVISAGDLLSAYKPILSS